MSRNPSEAHTLSHPCEKGSKLPKQGEICLTGGQKTPFHILLFEVSTSSGVLVRHWIVDREGVSSPHFPNPELPQGMF